MVASQPGVCQGGIAVAASDWVRGGNRCGGIEGEEGEEGGEHELQWTKGSSPGLAAVTEAAEVGWRCQPEAA